MNHFSHYGQRVAECTSETTIILWSCHTLNVLITILNGSILMLCRVALSPFLPDIGDLVGCVLLDI